MLYKKTPPRHPEKGQGGEVAFFFRPSPLGERAGVRLALPYDHAFSTIDAFCPPSPKLFDSTYFNPFISRATFGT